MNEQQGRVEAGLRLDDWFEHLETKQFRNFELMLLVISAETVVINGI